MNINIILVWITSLLIWIILWYVLVWYLITKRIKESQDKSLNIIQDANKKFDQTIKEAKYKSEDIVKEAERKASIIVKKVDQEKIFVDKERERLSLNFQKSEERLTKKEEKLDNKLEELELEKNRLIEKNKEYDNILDQQKNRLVEMSWLTQEQAKQLILERIENENKQEILNFINKYKGIKEEESKKTALWIITKILPRVAMNDVSEFLVTTIDLPSEDTKWKIIWREWRNISYFERLTWVELLIDDTPLAVKVSSYDPEKRYIAAEVLKKLIKDWRINPIYIEKIYKEISNWLDELHLEKWKETLQRLNIPMMKPDITKIIWQFNLRYSYWQNLLIHCMEVAKISEMIANELWLDWNLAKKAWLLHDIWKIMVWNGESHTKVWADLLRKYWFNDVIVNSAEWHHFDVPLLYPISRIVTAADAISAWRPWARFNSKDFFIDRMSNLENLIWNVYWIEKVYIMQAGREIMVFVNPEKVKDLELEKTLESVWKKIEDQLDYPWVIRIIAIRESKIVSFLK